MSPLRDASMGWAASNLSVIKAPSAAARPLFRRAGAIALATLLVGGANGSLAQELFSSYEPIELPLPQSELNSPPQAEEYHRFLQSRGQSTPRRLPPAHCDEPGTFGPPPCPPAEHAPPKRQVHHVFVQPPAGYPPAGYPALAPPAQQQNPPTPAGAFVAPPQSGTVVQEQRSIGIQGMRITFPKLTLELPSIELPHWIRRGRAAHMELAGGTAPYVASAPQAAVPRLSSRPMPSQAPMRRPPAPPQAQQPPSCDTPPAPAAGQPSIEEDFEALQRRCQRLEHLLEKMLERQPQPHEWLPPPQDCLPPADRMIPPPVVQVPPPQQSLGSLFQELPAPQGYCPPEFGNSPR